VSWPENLRTTKTRYISTTSRNVSLRAKLRTTLPTSKDDSSPETPKEKPTLPEIRGDEEGGTEGRINAASEWSAILT